MPHIKYLNDKEALMREIMINGAPDEQELLKVYKKSAMQSEPRNLNFRYKYNTNIEGLFREGKYLQAY